MFSDNNTRSGTFARFNSSPLGGKSLRQVLTRLAQEDIMIIITNGLTVLKSRRRRRCAASEGMIFEFCETFARGDIPRFNVILDTKPYIMTQNGCEEGTED
jgi:hypothetical protein